MSFFEFSEAQMKKQIYFTIIYRYDHSTADKVIADLVLDQFRKDILGVTNLYTNSKMLAFIMGTTLLKQYISYADKMDLGC